MPRRHRLTPADLTPEQLAAAGLSVPARGVLRSPHTGRGAKRGMSRIEQRFAAHLDSLKRAGAVAAWAYEPMSIALPASRARYRPDFALVAPGHVALDGGLVLVEVKPLDRESGRPYWQTASHLRFRLAARALDGLARLVVAWPDARGRWQYEEART